MRITALLASHNRRETTLRCLDTFFSQTSELDLAAVLVDDGSNDGTPEAVRAQFPRTEVIEADGTLYWATAMATAERVALDDAPDHLLWLNDDVRLDSDALARMVELAHTGEDRIVVGAVRDPRTGELSYSGVHRVGRHPLRFRRIPPGHQATEVETFNGNVVLVPAGVARRLGPIDDRFAHAAADFDYGLRATAAGIKNLLAPGTVGSCAVNESGYAWRDRSLPRRQRLAILLSPKGLPPRSRARYLRRHGGPLWPLYWLVPYAREIFTIAAPTRGSR